MTSLSTCLEVLHWVPLNFSEKKLTGRHKNYDGYVQMKNKIGNKNGGFCTHPLGLFCGQQVGIPVS